MTIFAGVPEVMGEQPSRTTENLEESWRALESREDQPWSDLQRAKLSNITKVKVKMLGGRIVEVMAR